MAKDIIGLDMSDASIEAIVLHKHGVSFAVDSYSRYKISPDIIDNGHLLKEDRLRESLLNMFKNGHPRPINPTKVYFSIPESRAFIRNINVPKGLKPKEIAEAIQHQAEETIPESFDNLLTAYQELSTNNNHREYTYIAGELDIVRSYLKLFKDLNIEVAGITTESIAAIAGLNDKFKKNTTLLLDLGSKVTIASIYDSRGIRASINIDIGGNAMLVAVKERFNISYADAENLLRDVGLTSAPGDGEVMLMLQGQLQPLTDEIKRFVAYWQQMSSLKIEQVVLIGGLTQMRGLVDYFSANLSVPAYIGESFLSDHKDKDQVVFTKYINALGLARLASTKSELNFYSDTNKSKLGLAADKATAKIIEDSQASGATQAESEEEPTWKKIITSIYFIVAIILVGLAGAIWFLRAPIKVLLNPKVSFNFTDKAVMIGVENKNATKDFVYAQLVPFTLNQQRDYPALGYDEVKSNILADMSKQLIDGLNKEYSKGSLYLIPAVVNTSIDDIQPSKENFVVGQALNIKATFQVLAINEFDIKNVLVGQLPEANDKSKAAKLDIKSFSYSIQAIDANSQSANLQVNMLISNK